MPPRSKVLRLPDETRRELEQKLIASGFSDYEGLQEWLLDKGFEISKSAIHRFGQPFAARMEALGVATQQAKAIVEGAPDDEGAMAEALMRLMQEKLFDVLLNMEVDPAKVNIGAVAKALAPIARASIALKKHSMEVRERAAAAADKVDALVKSGALSADAGADIRAEILGIARTPAA